MNTDINIITGKVCPYCDKPTVHCNDAVIYGRTYGSMMYVCITCDAYVGCHKPRPTEALGRLANKELREAKIKAHAAFDNLWRRKMSQGNISKSKARRFAYSWLSKAMKIPVEYCHIGFMDVAECKKVVEVCTPYLKPVINTIYS